MKSIKKIIPIILFAITLFACNNTNKNDENTNVDTIKSIINAPLPNLDIHFTNYSIDTQRDTVLIYETGSIINIPKNAFLDNEGNIITGKVDIEYREFSNAFDIYLGGIPMQYDSAGTNMIFETAGMLEINATSNNKPVYANPDNKINIDMNSFEQGERYNLYQLDSTTGEWSNIGKDKVEQKNYEDELAKLPTVPPEPKKATQFSFSIGDDTGKYPELNMYENVLFEPVAGKSCGFSCTEMRFKKLKYGKYEITFIMDYNGTILKEEKCICYLAFKEGVDYNKALKSYQKKYASSIAKRAKIKKRLEQEWNNYLKVKQIYSDAGMLDFFNKENIKSLKGENKIIRTLSINNFGFINCDYPSSYPQGAELIAKFTDKNGSKIKLKNIVLIEKGRNALFRYTTNVKFNPTKENILWGITETGNLAYFNSNDFKTVGKTKGNYTFSMKIHNKELKTYEDIVSVLFSSN